MKKAILTVVSVIFFFQLNAQEWEKNAFYLSEDLSFGNYVGGNFNLNYIFNYDHVIQAGISGYFREAKSQPSDYSSGLILPLFTFGLSDLESMGNIQVLYGRIIRAKNGRTTRYNLSGGLAYTMIDEPTNWQRVNSGFLGPNYTYDTKETNTVSLIFHPKIEFPFSRYFGVSLSSTVLVNKDSAFFGLGFGILGGYLRKERPQPTY
ncbi:hypothetical protein [Maribellus sp. YY47]|uniref:hypothetical protein n=1 Tax=Maribellus sp. YY47 TaxID=2929486 RepID=UPI002001973D|nr:hypothetical protein [Maribellus sp. YY47]MCK3685413.1 hypothetical protein [Maribellus sp. YY47]